MIAVAISVAVPVEITIMPVKIATPVEIIPIVAVISSANVACEVPAARHVVAVGGIAIYPNVAWDPLESTCRHASLSIL